MENRPKKLRVGFTGTQIGMRESQKKALRDVLEELSPIHQFHHGDCIGADAQAHEIALVEFGIPIYIHPCDIVSKRAFCQGARHVFDPEYPLLRNIDIVKACEIIIAAPKRREELRSGTWHTVRYARKAGREIHIIWPDGSRSAG